MNVITVNKYILVIAILVIILSGCKQRPIEVANLSNKRCIGGVAYVAWANGMTVLLGRDSKVILCDMKGGQE